MKHPSRLGLLLLLAGGALLLALFWPGAQGMADSPRVARFAVLSDPHLYDRALGTSGHAYESDLSQDVKLVAESEAVFTRAEALIKAEEPPPDFLLIPGDLTKDGEESSHRLMVKHLAGLEAAGIQVYVVPGNHDIANPAASRFNRRGALPVKSPSAARFAEMYGDFGYRQALARDPDSLSYLAEPVPGYWLIAIDTCLYQNNAVRRTDGGRIGPATRAWLLARLAEARKAGKTVIAMMHHGLLEQASGQGGKFPDLMIEDWQATGEVLASAGMNLVFTGHGHSQDITRKDWRGDAFLVDVRTGSLVTYPNPYRLVTLDQAATSLTIRTGRVDGAGTVITGDKPFTDFSRDFTYRRELGLIKRELVKQTKLSRARRDVLSTKLADAVIANYAGDERPTLRVFREALTLARGKNQDEAAIGALMLSLWHDLPPGDNSITMVLRGEAANGARMAGAPAKAAKAVISK